MSSGLAKDSKRLERMLGGGGADRPDRRRLR
jgi:hypothetical protein